MEASQQKKTRLKEMAIKNAISSWTDAKNGKFHVMNSYAKGETPEYYEQQIKYFENLKI